MLAAVKRAAACRDLPYERCAKGGELPTMKQHLRPIFSHQN
jgi:hypothetical protein